MTTKKDRKDSPKKSKEPVKQTGTQVHFGNIKLVEIKLLEAIAKNTQEIVRLLRDVKEEK